MMNMDNLDNALIDKHFQFAELSRQYSPSGIYYRVQRFIDDGLAEARKAHDSQCEHRAGNPYICRCQERRGGRSTL